MSTEEVGVPCPAPRSLDSHKGNYGRVLLIGGSLGMSGAIAISAQGAMRSGAGLVTIATPDRCADVVASFHPCPMVWPLPSDRRGMFSREALSSLRSRWDDFDVLAIGPGMGRSPHVVSLVLSLYDECTKPMVVDADGLFALSAWRRGCKIDFVRERLLRHSGDRVLTPHAGEFQKLSGVSAYDRDQQRMAAHELAGLSRLTILLKGNESLITDGRDRRFNTTGNPGMATGGSGDCLTGIVAGLIGQKMKPFDAASFACHWHGHAADLAIQELGGPSVLATDILQFMPSAFQQITKDRNGQ